MIGKNKIIFCAAEMHEAMEFYLNNNLLSPNHTTKVTSVTESKEMSCQTFEITIEKEKDGEE